MKIKLVFLSVILSVFMVNYSVSADSAIDSLLKCVEKHGLLKYFSDPDPEKPSFMTLKTFKHLMMTYADIYWKGDMSSDYIKNEVAIVACGSQHFHGNPLKNMGGYCNCEETIKNDCGNKFIEQLDKEIKLYDENEFLRQAKMETTNKRRRFNSLIRRSRGLNKYFVKKRM